MIKYRTSIKADYFPLMTAILEESAHVRDDGTWRQPMCNVMGEHTYKKYVVYRVRHDISRKAMVRNTADLHEAKFLILISSDCSDRHLRWSVLCIITC